MAERGGELGHGHRLLNGLMTLPDRRKALRAHAGGEHERHAPFRQDIRHRKHQLAGEVHVENRHVDARVVARQGGGARDVTRRTDDLATELEEHVLEELFARD